MDILIKYNELLDENKKLKEINSNVKKELMAYHVQREQLKEELKKSDHVKATLFEDRQKYKNEIIELSEKLYDAKIREKRLLKILNETDDYI